MRSHETDYFSLIAGALFTLMGVALMISAQGGWSIDGRWLVPIMLIALGGGGLAASLSASRRQHEAEALAAAENTASTSWPSDPFA